MGEVSCHGFEIRHHTIRRKGFKQVMSNGSKRFFTAWNCREIVG